VPAAAGESIGRCSSTTVPLPAGDKGASSGDSAGAAAHGAGGDSNGGLPAEELSEDFESCSGSSTDSEEAGSSTVPYNKTLLTFGLPRKVCERLVNPGFYDPFDVDVDVTLDNPLYRVCGLSLMKGKLDWVLLKGFRVLRKEMGNHDYNASDHKWLMVDVLPVP
jgi:hypothetical protein